MSKWHDLYQSKLTTAEEAAKTIKDGDRLFLGSGSSSPAGFLDVLFDRADELKDVLVGGLIMLAPMYKILSVDKMKNIEFDNFFATPLDRQSLADGISTHTPFHFSELPRLAYEGRRYSKIVTQVSPMDERGFMSAGLSGNFLDVLDKMDEVILEVNENQPRISGMNFYHIGDEKIKYVVENNVPVLTLPPEPVTDTERAIAEHIVEYIDDGATIQLGIGAVPNAIGECLIDSQKGHLGCYTEMIPDAIMNLFEAGVLDNSRKNFHPYQMNSFFTAGSQELYDWLDDNPGVYFTPISVNNDPYNVAKNDNMIAVNATIEIDIMGQCCSEAIGTRQYSATGGQVDFTRGAYMANNGKAFIATPSTYTDKNGELHSKIVPTLSPGTPVTLTRTDVMYVATEYGVALLKGMSMRERAQAMISLTHPDFRGELRQYAKDVKYFILPEHEQF
jgi:4-hydroxybutyrate CoA-transferase